MVAVPPCKLSLPAKLVGKARTTLNAALQEKFDSLWEALVARAFDIAEAQLDLGSMHSLWNLACETFLLKFCTGDWDAALPSDKPRRGKILPRQAQPLASGCSYKQANATSSYAN